MHCSLKILVLKEMDILGTINSWLSHSLLFSCEWSAMLTLFHLLPFACTLFFDILTKSVNNGKEASRGNTFCVYRARVLMFPELPQPVTRPQRMEVVAIETEASQEFHGSLVVRILGLHFCSLGSTPGQGTKIIQAMWYSQPSTEASQQSPS